MKPLSLPQLFMLSVLLLGLVSPPWPALAEGYAEPESSAAYGHEELAQMLAPIALYPDALLSQVLMASTYPVEVVEADRWVGSHPELTDAALDEALLDQEWDPSVKALCHFPSILALMSERIGETEKLGDAFLAQEAEVMDVVQELRAKAQAQGRLAATAEQKVRVEDDVIVIEPADPRVVYVPYYDPAVVYGPWWYPDYPPWYWGPPGVAAGVGLSYWPGVYFGFSFTNWSYFDWRHHYVHIDAHQRPRFVRHDRWRTTPGRWTRHGEPRPMVISPPPPPASTVIIHRPWPPDPVGVHRDPFGPREYYDQHHDWPGDRRHIERSRHELEQRHRERDDHDDRQRDDRDRKDRDRSEAERPRDKPEPPPPAIETDPDRRPADDSDQGKPGRDDRDRRKPRGDEDKRPTKPTVGPDPREGKPAVSPRPPKPLEEVRKPPVQETNEPGRTVIDPFERLRQQPNDIEDNRGKQNRSKSEDPPRRPQAVVDPFERLRQQPTDIEDNRDRRVRDERPKQPRLPQVITPAPVGGGETPAKVRGPDQAGQGHKRTKPKGPIEEPAISVGPNEL